MTRREFRIWTGTELPQLGNGQRIVQAELGRKWVKEVYLPHRRNALTVPRSSFDRVIMQDKPKGEK